MTAPRSTELLLRAFLADGLTELSDRSYHEIRREIHHARQRRLIGPWRTPDITFGRGFAATAAAVLVVGVVLLSLRPGGGPGAVPTPSATASPAPTSQPSAQATPSGPTTFTSPLYGYTLTVPAGWIAAEAVLRWDGVNAPGPDAEVDKFAGPEQFSAGGYAGPFAGDLAALVDDRIAANARDHSDTCPVAVPELNEPISIAGQRGVLLAWNCGAVINVAMTVRGGVAYVFGFRDLSVHAATTPADRALFQSILDTVELPD